MFRNTSLQREGFFTSLRFHDAKKLGAVAAGTIRAVRWGIPARGHETQNVIGVTQF